MRWSVRAEACSYLLTPLFCDNFHGIISYTETLYTFHLVPFTVSPVKTYVWAVYVRAHLHSFFPLRSYSTGRHGGSGADSVHSGQAYRRTIRDGNVKVNYAYFSLSPLAESLHFTFGIFCCKRICVYIVQAIPQFKPRP